ncbi:hypothetical protein GDO86_004881 [Hymenochirus boettgeri]|uniref:Uncharacterized protein n=1 Tax=Hymenochirus boettgeri TaxID=247094 RepID=A0A8T2J4A4_9PIPI|nr:hypothetical protein GDO86_004881 [Hymenochirus boettgeri]
MTNTIPGFQSLLWDSLVAGGIRIHPVVEIRAALFHSRFSQSLLWDSLVAGGIRIHPVVEIRALYSIPGFLNPSYGIALLLVE